MGRRLFQGDFADREARDELYKRMTELGLEESVRVWIATILNSYPVQADVTGITQDIAAGPRGLWSLRTAYKEGSDELTVGHLWVLDRAFHLEPGRRHWRRLHVGHLAAASGSGHVEPPVFRQATGVSGWTSRSKPRVRTALWKSQPMPCTGTPADRPGSPCRRTPPRSAASNTTTAATSSRLSITAGPSRWRTWCTALHQGIDISLNPQKALIETVIATTARPYLETIKGYRVLDENRIETYVDFWHFEEDYIAGYGIPSSVGTPWELLAALDTLVFEQRRGAYTDTTAARFKVPWISLVLDRDARLVRRVLLDMKRKQTVPESVFELPGRDEPLVDTESALAGYDALLDWFGEKGHLVIGNGPFSLERYDPGAQ